MKKCKNPQCLTQISENAPDFCPDHNEQNPHTHKEEPRSWEGWDDLRIKLRTASSYEREALVYKFVATREKEVREEIIESVATLKTTHPFVDASTLVAVIETIKRLTPKTEIR